MLCYIGVGSNLGNRLKNIKEAILYLKQVKGVTIKRFSPIYETEPWGLAKGQREYFNLVLEIACELKPQDLFSSLKDIEKKIGRKPRKIRWSAREIDLDILFCDGLIIKDKNLEIPHPLLQERFFVLKPLSDLVPHLRHPLFGCEVNAMLASLKESGRWRKIEWTS